jgi:hypothetical protein
MDPSATAHEQHLAGCDAFWLWALPGALFAFAFITGFTIGILVVPFALLALVLVNRSERAHAVRGAGWGSLGGVGATLIGIGVLNADASWFAYWLLAGGVALAVAMAAFTFARRLP